jgi:hypothetical protein
MERADRAAHLYAKAGDRYTGAQLVLRDPKLRL